MTVELGIGISLIAVSCGGFGYALNHDNEAPFVATISFIAAIFLILDALKLFS